jgi:hypothetical protein
MCGAFTFYRQPPTGDIMTMTSEAVNKEFKVWMTVTLGLIKDGKMGASPARAERIKTALAYAGKKS